MKNQKSCEKEKVKLAGVYLLGVLSAVFVICILPFLLTVGLVITTTGVDQCIENDGERCVVWEESCFATTREVCDLFLQSTGSGCNYYYLSDKYRIYRISCQFDGRTWIG